MRILKFFLFLFFLFSVVDANEKWISLKSADEKIHPRTIPVTKNTNTQIDINQIKPVKNMLDKIKIAKYFLDKEVTQQKPAEQKRWFKLN